MQLTRRDVGYTIISRFEESFRHFLSDKLSVFFSDYQEGIPAGVVDKAKDRSSQASWDGLDDFLEDTDFPDLKEIVCYKGMYQKYFPDIGYSQDNFQITMDELHYLRCKIAHIKQYFTSIDLDKLLENTRKIATYLNLYGKEFLGFTQELEQHPDKLIVPTPLEFTCDGDLQIDSIPNNIPTPDYEYEGGFVGREDDITKVINLLEGDLHRVITISGAGGVGKTALALRVVQKLLLKSSENFDGIIWLSAKETRLSYLGIEDIEPTIKDYEQLLDTVFEVMGFGAPSDAIEEKESDIHAIFNLHKCILIVIDNLETITDERIINFILDAHPKTKILITSRRGLGQVERRYELKQLKVKEAVYLFRLIGRDKNLISLATLDDDTLKSYVRKLSCYPLAIKWVIGQVAIGKDINEVISSINETTSDISRFCFDQIYDSLSVPAKKILCALSVFDETPSAGVLNYVIDIDQDDFEDGIQELILVSLVIPEQYKNEQDEISSRYTLLSLTRGYVRQQLDKDPLLKRAILERLQTVQATIEEATRAKKLYRFSLANLGATTEEEKVAAMIAQTAFQKYQAGRYADAVEDYKRAIEIAPRFASLYRNWAVMEAQEGHSIEADELMRKAGNLSSKDPQIWLAWGNIKRKENKVREALQKYEIAYKLSPEDGVILNALGQAKARLGEYEEADRLFRLALQKEPAGDTMRHRIINLSSLGDNLHRWAQNCKQGRDYKAAEKKLKEALQICEEVVELDKRDIRSLELLRKVLIELGFLYKSLGDPQTAVNYFTRAIVNKPVKLMGYREARDTAVAALQAGIILYKLGEIDKAKGIFSSELRKIRDPLRRNPGLQADFQAFWEELYERVRGRIVRVEPARGFVIIETLSSLSDTFLGHINSFETKPKELSNLLLDNIVSFTPAERNTGSGIRKDARSIRIIQEM